MPRKPPDDEPPKPDEEPPKRPDPPRLPWPSGLLLGFTPSPFSRLWNFDCFAKGLPSSGTRAVTAQSSCTKSNFIFKSFVYEAYNLFWFLSKSLTK